MMIQNVNQNQNGCSKNNIYTIKVLKLSKVTLTFEYSYFVELEDTSHNKIAINDIVVDNDLNIKENHYGTYFEDN